MKKFSLDKYIILTISCVIYFYERENVFITDITKKSSVTGRFF